MKLTGARVAVVLLSGDAYGGASDEPYVHLKPVAWVTGA